MDVRGVGGVVEVDVFYGRRATGSQVDSLHNHGVGRDLERLGRDGKQWYVGAPRHK